MPSEGRRQKVVCMMSSEKVRQVYQKNKTQWKIPRGRKNKLLAKHTRKKT
jgi:hypothetical protein